MIWAATHFNVKVFNARHMCFRRLLPNDGDATGEIIVVLRPLFSETRFRLASDPAADPSCYAVRQLSWVVELQK